MRGRRAYLAGNEPGDRVTPCAPKRCLREGASPLFRQDAGGWRHAAPSLDAPFRTMYRLQNIDKLFKENTTIIN